MHICTFHCWPGCFKGVGSYLTAVQCIYIAYLVDVYVSPALQSAALFSMPGLTPEHELLSCRRDVFKSANLPVPRTWDDVLNAARQLYGNDPTYIATNITTVNFTGNSSMNFSGNLSASVPPPFYGLCITRNAACPYTAFNLAAILAPMLIVNGTSDGFYFDPDTMQPLVRSAAMRRALEILR